MGKTYKQPTFSSEPQFSKNNYPEPEQNVNMLSSYESNRIPKRTKPNFEKNVELQNEKK